MIAKRGVILTIVLAGLSFGLLLTGPAAETAWGAETLGTPYKNEEYGFKFVTFKGWTAFPPEPGEKTTIVFFRTAKTGRGLAYEATCFISLLNDKCPSLQDYMNDVRRYMGVSAKKQKFLPASKLPKGTDQFEFGFAGRGCRGAGLGCEYTIGEKRIGVVYVCNSRQMKKYKRNFMYSLMSLKPFEPKKAKVDDDDGGSLGPSPKKIVRPIEKRYKSLQSSKPPGWDLKYYGEKFPYYIFYSNCKPSEMTDVIRHLQWMRPQYEKYIPPLEKKLVDMAAPIVRICKDQNDFMTYSGMGGGVGGYWSSFRGELVLFKKSQILGSMKDLFFDILHHEAYHQYIYYACGEVDPHIIFHEGPAEFFGAFKLKGGKMVPTLKNQMRQSQVKSDVSTESFVPFKKIFHMSQREYYANAGQCYAQGWAMTTFMLLGKKYMGPAFKDRWAEIIPIYFSFLQGEVGKELTKIRGKVTQGDGKEGKGEAKDGKEDSGNSRSAAGFIGAKKRKWITEEAMKSALDGVDLEEMEKAYCKFVKKFL
ncbi:MAG: hypothetical protein ACYTFG_02915 [Planctomycetota bacterium]|jgi:hypothetical protein